MGEKFLVEPRINYVELGHNLLSVTQSVCYHKNDEQTDLVAIILNYSSMKTTLFVQSKGGVVGIAVVVLLFFVGSAAHAAPWTEHTITYSPTNTDGTEFGPHGEIATVNEQIGQAVLCFPPSGNQVVQWPCMVVYSGLTGAEHASFASLGGGRYALISAGEGASGTTTPAKVVVSIAPADVNAWPDASQWTSTILPSVLGLHRWLTTFPIDIDADGIDEVMLGSKSNGFIGYLKAPSADPLDAAQWTYYEIKPATVSTQWIMSLEPINANDDGLTDILFTDRTGKVGVLVNPGPGPAQTQPWVYKQITALGGPAQVRFGDVADMNGDGLDDVVVAVYQGVRVFIRQPGVPWSWASHFYGMPVEFAGTQTKDAKGIDIDGNGVRELMLNSIHSANGSNSGVAIIPYVPGVDVSYPNSTAYIITDPAERTKFDECKEIRLQYPQAATLYVHGEQIVPDPSAPPDLVCTGEGHTSRGGVWAYLNPLARPGQ
jgi:hypothetical protein